jgi:hypothetical protein
VASHTVAVAFAMATVLTFAVIEAVAFAKKGLFLVFNAITVQNAAFNFFTIFVNNICN